MARAIYDASEWPPSDSEIKDWELSFALKSAGYLPCFTSMLLSKTTKEKIYSLVVERGDGGFEVDESRIRTIRWLVRKEVSNLNIGL